MLENEINKLKGRIVGYSHHVGNMIEQSIIGLMQNDKKILKQVINKEEEKANKFDNSIEKQVVAALAQFSPKAYNLRILLMILKMNNDIERIGDHCVNISYNAKDIIKCEAVTHSYKEKINAMSVEVIKMFRDSIDAFINEDADAARDVCDADEVVNKYQRDIVSYLTDEMSNNPDKVQCALHFINIVNNLERIADLSTNVAEDCVFIFDGKVIKH